MAIVTFNKKQFEKDIGKLTENLKDKIAMFGTPIEKIENQEIQIEIFPDRPDLLSYQGYKRSFLAFLGKKTGLKKYKIKKPEKNYKVNIDSSVKDVRPYTACAIVKGIKLSDDKIKEIIEIQEKLHTTVGRKRKKLAIGIYPLEEIKLPITYKALEPDKIKFTPLESSRKMSGLEILQRHPVGKDYAHLLAGKTKFPIFIDANKNILSMPPIINSQLTGKITKKTKDVFVECSGYDFDLLKKCLNIIVTSLSDIGGTIYQMKLKYKKRELTPDLSTEKMKISLENTNKTLGLNLNEKQLKSLLEKMGYDYEKGFVQIPNWRLDILHEVDLIEDVAIAYGYDKFKPEIPSISTIGHEDPKETIKRKIAETLASIKFLEVSNYHLTNPNNQFKKMGIPEKQKKEFIKVEDSKTDYTILRKDLSHYMMKVFSENVDAEYPQKIFEIGKVFRETTQEDRKLIDKKSLRAGQDTVSKFGGNLQETEHLATAISPADFTQIKQVLKYLSRMLNIEIKSQETEDFPLHFIDGRVAEIILTNEDSDKLDSTKKREGGTFKSKKLGIAESEKKGSNSQIKIGYIGEIHPRILKNWKLKMPVVLFEISLEEIFEELI